MAEVRKRLTLDLDAALQRRLKARAAIQGVSMRHYCIVAIEKELARSEGRLEVELLPFGEGALDRLQALQASVFEGGTLPGDAAEMIREARADRTAQH